jgi:hypothetical protein
MERRFYEAPGSARRSPGRFAEAPLHSKREAKNKTPTKLLFFNPVFSLSLISRHDYF